MLCVLRGCVKFFVWVSFSTWAGLLVSVRGCKYFFVKFFFKVFFEFYYWDLSFLVFQFFIVISLQSHLKMLELCATTRLMFFRHPTPIVVVWDVARR